MQRWIDEAADGNVRQFALGAEISPPTLYRGLKDKAHDFNHATMDKAEAYHRKQMIERAAREAAARIVETTGAPAIPIPDRELLELAIRAGQDIGLPLTSPILAFLASGTYVTIARMRARGVPLEGDHAFEVAKSVAETLIGGYPDGELDKPKPE